MKSKHRPSKCKDIKSFATKRASGVLLHITSLPSEFGIGDLGRGAFDFINFLVNAEQQYWQLLPLVPTCGVFGHSPYASFSAFAGNPLLISPHGLLDDGFIETDDLATPDGFSEYYVDFPMVQEWKENLLRLAHEEFKKQQDKEQYGAFKKNMVWLDDYSLFMALKEERDKEPWYEWPAGLRHRKPAELKKARNRLANEIDYFQFEQYCFFNQLKKLRAFAGQKGVELIGDIPIYVSLDSADVWMLQDCFHLNAKTGEPIYVAGVPPDYFSDTGQRWGNPIYRWKNKKGSLNEDLMQWWVQRLEQTFKMVDIVRVDHFRGFESYWEIPAEEETAIKGRWVKGPGLEFFHRMEKELGALPIIAEDLGIITPEVEKLRDDLGFPGMKILQFAFDSDAANTYLPHNYPSTNTVVYTGTHDNDTVVGWFLSPEVMESSKERARRYANHPGSKEMHWDFIRMAFSSTAAIAITPMQDVLGFGGDCRFNMPSTTEGNWQWRCAARFLSGEVQNKLAGETRFYNRERRMVQIKEPDTIIEIEDEESLW